MAVSCGEVSADLGILPLLHFSLLLALPVPAFPLAGWLCCFPAPLRFDILSSHRLVQHGIAAALDPSLGELGDTCCGRMRDAWLYKAGVAGKYIWLPMGVLSYGPLSSICSHGTLSSMFSP